MLCVHVQVERREYGPLQERLARSLLSPAAGAYCLLSHNCQDYADYVATGSMHRRDLRQVFGKMLCGGAFACVRVCKRAVRGAVYKMKDRGNTNPHVRPVPTPA